jgi:S-adenosyl-L-methionine hydrolase (adenosine-forming)
LAASPQARIVDLSHGMPAGRPDLAGFWLARAWRDFPVGTLHLAVVDPGVGTARGVVLALVAEGRLLLAPDNGLLPEALRGQPAVVVAGMDGACPPASACRLPRGLPRPRPVRAAGRSTRRGRLAAGRLRPPADARGSRRRCREPMREADGVLGRVMLADRFGNLITNIDAGLPGRVAASRMVEAGGLQWPWLDLRRRAARGARWRWSMPSGCWRLPSTAAMPRNPARPRRGPPSACTRRHACLKRGHFFLYWLQTRKGPP